MQPVIRDSTLREGVELPGICLSLKEKLGIARLLEEANVREMEIGMPYGMKDCIPLAAAIKKEKLKVKTSALILSYRLNWKEEISLASRSKIDRFEVLFPSSDILLKMKSHYKVTKQGLERFIEEKIRFAKRHLAFVGVGFVDSTRTDISFLKKLVATAKLAGADRAIIYDTVGIGTPEKISELIGALKKYSHIPLVIHCHNDFGLASANSIAGIIAGAAGCDVVVNGLGDRGGNASFEQVVVALEELYGVNTGIKLQNIYALAKHVEKITAITQSPVRPIAGDFTFLHSPVQHIYNAASKNTSGFEPFKPELVGAQRKYGFTLPVDYSIALEPFYKRLKIKPDEKHRGIILARLRQKSKRSGLTEQEVLRIIKENT